MGERDFRVDAVQSEKGQELLLQDVDALRRLDPAALDHLAHGKTLVQFGAPGNQAVGRAYFGELVLALQVHPQLGARAERIAQLDGGFGRDGLLAGNHRSEESRVGKEGVSTCRLRLSPYT